MLAARRPTLCSVSMKPLTIREPPGVDERRRAVAADRSSSAPVRFAMHDVARGDDASRKSPSSKRTRSPTSFSSSVLRGIGEGIGIDVDADGRPRAERDGGNREHARPAPDVQHGPIVESKCCSALSISRVVAWCPVPNPIDGRYRRRIRIETQQCYAV